MTVLGGGLENKSYMRNQNIIWTVSSLISPNNRFLIFVSAVMMMRVTRR